MGYVEGFVSPVPTGNKEKYRTIAAETAGLFKEFGATRVVQAWGNDIPDGKVTDFKRAVQAENTEAVVLSWIEYPSKSVRDKANAKMAKDDRMREIGKSIPFDGKRMIFGGFDAIVDETGSGTSGYTDGYAVPVPNANKQAYRKMAAKTAAVFTEHGATRVVEAWGDDVPDGKVTDFKRAVQAKTDENVVFSFVEWPNKALRDDAWEKVMQDERMQPDPNNMPFDGKRMFWGGFELLLDE